MKPKVKVGQLLYRLNIGNKARSSPPRLTPVIVTKVGSKYFTAKTENDFESQYHIGSWSEKSNYSAGYVLYESEQAYEDEKEAKKICEILYKDFEYGHNRRNVNIETLRKIVAMMHPVDNQTNGEIND